MHRLRGVASDVHEEHTPEGVVFEARLPAAEAGRYARFRLEPEMPGEPDARLDDATTSRTARRTRRRRRRAGDDA